MKKLFLILFAAATFYLGGAYRFPPLLAAACAALLMLPAMFILSRALRKNFGVKFIDTDVSAEKGEALTVPLLCENSGKLPVTICRADISAAYPNMDPTGIKLRCGADANSKRTKDLSLKAPYCGLVDIKIEKLHICDWLNIFAAPKKSGCECRAAVYPAERSFDVSLSPSFGMSGFSDRRGIRGGSGDEIKNLREYEHGDSARLIHKNQSAKTGELWIKELEKQADFTAELYLDMSGADGAEPETMDLFYEVLSALTAGLLKTAAAVRIFYSDGENRVMTARNRKDILTALFKLYGTDPETFGSARVPDGGVLLDLGCGLRRDGKIIKKFSRENFDSEPDRKIELLSSL